MTRAEALRDGAAAIPAAVSRTPALDATLLLASVTGLTKERLLAERDAPLGPAEEEAFLEATAKRARGLPVALIVGRKEFYGRDFLVGPGVLVPRPDTELLVELALAAGDALAADGRAPLRLHEVGVGSGAVVVSIAAERPDWIVSGSDLSEGALAMAGENARRLLPGERPGGPLLLHRGDLLEGVPGPFDLLVSNPPYVESDLARELAARWGEPELALDGGEDGLDVLRRLIPQAAAALAPGGLFLVEADPSQAGGLRELFAASGLAEARSERDLGGHERVTLGRKG